jgi:hypothetical protein
MDSFFPALHPPNSITNSLIEIDRHKQAAKKIQIHLLLFRTQTPLLHLSALSWDENVSEPSGLASYMPLVYKSRVASLSLASRATKNPSL